MSDCERYSETTCFFETPTSLTVLSIAAFAQPLLRISHFRVRFNDVEDVYYFGQRATER